MALPNFICVGAEKGGTTPLTLILKQHSNVYVSPQKETHYFSRLYTPQNLVFYETFYFKGHGFEQAVGELTPDYMRYPEVPQRIHDTLGPGLKLIFCLRDPLKRAFSHYLQCVRILEENDSFESAIALEQARFAEDRRSGLRRAYIGGSLYFAQIARFLEHFPRENMFFMILEEDFIINRARTMARLFDFLGAGPDPRVNLDVRDTSLPPPRVRFVQQPRHVRYEIRGAKGTLAPGAILYTTGNKGGDRVITSPSPAVTGFFQELAARMTRELPGDLGEALYRTHFRDEVSRIEELLGRDLTVWRPR